MTVVASFGFGEANGTAITSCTGSIGGETLAAASWNGGTAPTTNSGKMRYPGDQFVRKAHYMSVVPSSADYTAFVTRTVGAESSRVTAGVRMSTSAQTGYFGGFDSTAQVAIWKWLAGTPTQIGAAINCTQSSGDWYAETQVTGGATPTISLYVQRKSDNQWLASGNTFQASKVACITVTDSSSPITAAGRAGIWAETTGTSVFDLDNLGMDDPGAGGTNATASGTTLAATSSLVAGAASGQASGTASGVTLTAAASLVAGSAAGQIVGTLNMQAAGNEFIARTGLAISTFAREVGIAYKVEVYADGLTLGSPIYTSGSLTTDSNGKLPNISSVSLTPGATVKVVPTRQTDGISGAPRRMVVA